VGSHSQSRVTDVPGAFFWQASAKSYSFQLPPPAAGAEVRRGALRDKRMALLWSDGTLQTYDIGTSAARRAAAAPQPETGVSLQLRGFALTAPQVGLLSLFES